jgi:hypothetical protein
MHACIVYEPPSSVHVSWGQSLLALQVLEHVLPLSDESLLQPQIEVATTARVTRMNRIMIAPPWSRPEWSAG